MSFKKIIFLNVLLTTCLNTFATEHKKLNGTYKLDFESIIDPKSHEKPNTHLRFRLTGATATDLYKAMPIAAKRDECRDDGTVTKTIGEMECSKLPKNIYECFFGIALKTQKITTGVVC